MTEQNRLIKGDIAWQLIALAMRWAEHSNDCPLSTARDAYRNCAEELERFVDLVLGDPEEE